MIKTIGVVVKHGSTTGYEIARKVLEYGSDALGLEMLLDEEVSIDINWRNTFSLCRDKVDVIMVIGGDGTLFRTLHKLGENVVPIMTVKAGRRGFLLDVYPEEVLDRLKDLVEGRYRLVEYMRLGTSIEGRYSRVLPLAINDVVVTNYTSLRTKIIRIRLSVDGDELYRVDGDGIVIATPLGSSGYALSAGGSLIDIDLEAVLITPIAPIQFNAKPVVLAPSRRIDIEVLSESGPAACIVDGQSIETVYPGEVIEVSRAKSKVPIIRFRYVNSYARLKSIE